MKKIIDTYTDSYEKNGDTPGGVLWPKGRQHERFESLIRWIPQPKLGNTTSLLDYGCGLAHLYNFLKKYRPDINYTGVDITPALIEASKKRELSINVSSINSHNDIDASYDYIVASGVFNILYSADRSSHWDITKKILLHLFNRTNVTLSVNFMSAHVDYLQHDAYHQSLDELVEFSSKHLSRRFNIDQMSLPYEFTFTVWKNAKILKPDNVFEL